MATVRTQAQIQSDLTNAKNQKVTGGCTRMAGKTVKVSLYDQSWTLNIDGTTGAIGATIGIYSSSITFNTTSSLIKVKVICNYCGISCVVRSGYAANLTHKPHTSPDQALVNRLTSELNEAEQRDTAITNFNNLNSTVTNKTQLTTLKTYLDQIATYSGANSTIHNEYNTKYLTTTNKLDVAASVSGVLDKLKINQNDVIPKLALKYNEAYNTGLVNYSECKNVIGVLTDY